ncbi:hypothetical protein SAMN05661091_2286 [Paenibacillus uliginis N3/975]|uniref:Uncharacterized protein n=1 Tax=Paenibacillus uliginis N3/975 TaxID=1313296 RepID=A0A1X7HAW5_9BACL|nr:hypothetical protein [Paenibacillus uliginis]SMF83004.1 hypothetical protein SAMN05661091_2286 [Paenibacillus uliginis N3/975]
MAGLGGVTGGAETGYVRSEKGVPDVHMKTEWGGHSHVAGSGHHMTGHKYGQMHGHVHHDHMHGHGCVPAPIHVPVVKKGVAPELILFILLVIIIRCFHY